MSETDESKGIPPSPFDLAYGQWLSARAALVLCVASDEAADGEIDALQKNLDAAEWKLIQIPTGGLLDIRRRAEFVQWMFNQSATEGDPSDGRDMAGLAALCMDITVYRDGD